MRTLFLTVIILMFAACLSPEQTKESNVSEREKFVLPVDWKEVTECSIAFFVPPDLEEKKPYYVIHSSKNDCIKAYGSENIWLNIGSGKTSYDNSLYAKEREYQLEKVDVGGKQVEISTFTGSDMVNEAKGKEFVAILDVSQKSEATKSLKMWAYSKTPADREIVIKIFKSVRFLNY